MSGLQLIELAEKRGLLDPTMVSDLREKLRAKGDSVTAKEVAHHLVKRGRLTQFQADGLLDDVRLVAEAAADGVDLLGDTDEAIEVSSLELIDEGEDLALTPLDVEPVGLNAAPPRLPTTAQAVEDLAAALQPDNDEVPAVAVETAKAVLQPWEDAAPQPTAGGWKSLFVRQKGWRSRKRGGPSLLMLGTGALVLMSVLGIFIFFFLTRETGDEYFDAAEQDYKAEAYDNAIKKYDLFAAKFKKHPKVSLARVRGQLARMRNPVQSQAWDRALQAVTTGITEIRDEPAFDQALPELAGILPAIYEGFAQRAAAATAIDVKDQQLAEAAQVMELIEDPQLLPGSQRRAIDLRLKAIEKDIALVKREIARQRGLEDAIRRITSAVEDDHETAKAYAIHKQLLQQYPGLRTNGRLADAVRLIAEREKFAVVVEDGQLEAATDDHPSVAGQRVLLAKRQLKAKASADGQLFSVANGALYGLSADDGRVLWRRYLGLAPCGIPVTIGGGARHDVLVIDPLRQEILRLDGTSGELVWRLPLGERCGQPVVALDRVLVTLQTGKLLSIDPMTGNVVRMAQVPQQLYSPPAVSTDRGIVYQAGDHSSVYVFAADSLECLGVHATGHQEGSVSVAPILVGDHLLVAERSGTDYTRLIPLALTERGLGSTGEGWPDVIRIEGHVTSANTISDNAVLLATNSGAAYIVASEGLSGDNQVHVAARTPVTTRSASPFFGMTLGDTVLVAGRGLERFEYQAANGLLISRWALAEPSTHIAPPLKRGSTLVVQYKRSTSQAVRVAALVMSAPSSEPEVKWTVDLGSSPAGPPIIDKKNRAIVAVSSDGSAWELDAKALNSGRLDQAAAALPGRTQFVGGAPLADGSRFFAARDKGTGYLIYDSSQRGSHLQRREARLPAQELACSLVPAGDRLIACTNNGFVYLVDPKSGKPAAEPFQPKLKIGATVDWIRPTGVAGDQLVVGTSSGDFRLLKLQEGRLVADVSQLYPGKYRGPIRATGEHVFVARRSGRTDEIVCLQASDLALVATTPLAGALADGPFVVGEFVVCTTDDNQMHAFDATGQPAWSAEMPAGPLVGAPIAAGDGWVCASANGQLWRVSQATGKTQPWRAGDPREVHYVGEPLGSRPVLVGSRLFVLGRDSTLFVVSLN